MEAPKWKFLTKAENETKAKNQKRQSFCQLLAQLRLWLWQCTNLTKIMALQLDKWILLY